MRLSAFISENIEPILQEWEDFARSLVSGSELSIAALRDHAELMLRFIAADLETKQSDDEEAQKSLGGPWPQQLSSIWSAAESHGHLRAVDRFTITEMVSEYRALRASVTRLWLHSRPLVEDTAQQLIRFNEAIDQILAESVLRFSQKIDADADLLTASISHDLRNPLQAIVMSAQMLKRSPSLAEADRAVIVNIDRGAARLQSMLRELQDLTRARLGSLGGYRRQRSDVVQLCREIVEEARAAHPGRDVQLTGMASCLADVDAERFGQMLSNLVGNALQHGAAERSVRVVVAEMESEVTVQVVNEGELIKPDVAARMFEPLQRGSDTGAGSLGLGLYIARTIALAHSATISVKSEEGSGTVFTVRFPRPCLRPGDSAG